MSQEYEGNESGTADSDRDRELAMLYEKVAALEAEREFLNPGPAPFRSVSEGDTIRVPFARNNELKVFWNKKLGEGSFGKVYECEWKGKRYAGKHLRDPDQDGRFENEIAPLYAAGEHPNVVAIRGIHVFGPSTLIICDLCDCSLESDDAKKTPYPERSCWALDIARGLVHLHSRGILHRDIKPSNIMMRDGRALIGDLGSAKVCKETLRAGTYAGTLQFMAPEVIQARGLGSSYTGAADVYSFGITLYCLGSGRDPPETSEILDTSLVKIPAWREVITRCVVSDPATRPSFDEIVAVLSDEGTGWDEPKALPVNNEAPKATWIVPETGSAPEGVVGCEPQSVPYVNSNEVIINWKKSLGAGLWSRTYESVWRGLPYATSITLDKTDSGSMNRLIATLCQVAGHENVITLHAIFFGKRSEAAESVIGHSQRTTDLMTGLLFDLCDSSLRRVLPSADRLTKIRLARDVARGMRHVHGRGIAHRNLNPDTILVKKGRAMISGFLLAASCGEDGLHDIRGTPAFMDPRIFAALRGMTGRADTCADISTLSYGLEADVFSFGATLIQIAIAHPPKRLPGGEIVVPSPQKLSVPEFHSLIEHCVCGDPEARPAFAEIEDRLERLVAQVDAGKGL